MAENSKPLLLIGSPIDFGGGDKEQAHAILHLAFICELYEIQVRRGRYFLHTHSNSADSWDQSTLVDFMNRFPDTFQTVTDSCLFGPKSLGKVMKTLTGWLTNCSCIAQALSTQNHSPSLRQSITKAMSVVVTTQQPQHRPPLPKLDILAVDADEAPPEEWEAEDDVKGGLLDPLEAKALVKRKYSIGGTWRCTSVRVLHRSRGTGTHRTQPCWPQVDRYQQR